MHWKNRTLDFTQKTYVMGIINGTPDSFFAGSRRTTLQAGLDTARDMIACGVDLIDIGGESSRPGSKPVPVEEELQRVVPLIEAIRRESEIMISIDTWKTPVAAAALAAGADLVNDIYALRNNPTLARLIAGRGVPVILMHMQGDPATMQQHPVYADTIGEIKTGLQAAAVFAEKNGIAPELIILDPGIGFGKRLEDNLRIIKHLAEFRQLGYPLLIGLSRKSFLGAVLDKATEERLAGTITANTIAVLNGAGILRVHDYREAVDLVKVIRAIQAA